MDAGRPSRARLVLLVVAGVTAALTACGGTGGDVATWELGAPDTVTADSDRLDVLVTRLGCASGETGEVLEPQVRYEERRIVVQVDVAPFGADAADCQGNDAVPVTVDLVEPVGEREIVDGACLDGEAADTAPCQNPVRWP